MEERAVWFHSIMIVIDVTIIDVEPVGSFLGRGTGIGHGLSSPVVPILNVPLCRPPLEELADLAIVDLPEIGEDGAEYVPLVVRRLGQSAVQNGARHV